MIRTPISAVFLCLAFSAAAGSAAAQQAQDPPSGSVPAGDLVSGEGALATPGSDIPAHSAPMAPSPAPAPPAAASAEPAQVPLDRAEVAALRDAYDNLRRREAEARTLSDPASNDTRQALQSANARADEIDALLPMAQWKANTMEWYATAMAAEADLTLPQSTPTGMTLNPSLAGVQSGAIYYSTPLFSDATVMGSIAQATSVLRVAEGIGAQLVWIPNAGFAFMTRQSLEIYQ